MKITFVLPPLNLTGGIRVVAIYAERLQKLGHQVCVVATPYPKPSLRQQVKSLLKGKGLIPADETSASHFDNRDVQVKIIDRWRPITDADVPDADVVVATWWETAEWVANLSASKGAKAYFIQHHEVFDYLPKERVAATWALPMHKITIAQWLVDLGREKYGDSHMSLAPNGVDLEQFHAAPRGKQSIPTVGLVYTSLYWKGCDISLKAFSIAKNKFPNLRLVVFSNESEELETPLPPGTEYVFCPPQSSLKDLYSKCDAWLFGSRSEGFGLPIVEAMACRTPVIGTPAGAAPELLSDGAGILLDDYDPEEMAKAIERICQLSDAEWKVMSDDAYAKSITHTWDKSTELFEAGLKRAINKTLVVV
ncbi:MAG: glycosyltransferase family 4 protein [Potamolinea sp.]